MLGDSTGAGQGAVYEDGVAVGTARHLARSRAVELVNLSASGATTAEVLTDQVPVAARLRPDGKRTGQCARGPDLAGADTIVLVLRRLQAAFGALSNDQRIAGLAALGLVAAMLLPWYEKSVYDPRGDGFARDTLSAFGAVSFVEAAVFLVAVGVLALLFARGERRAFELPGGDGTVVLAAGAWAAMLIFYRALDRPDVEGRGATIGVQWGFLVAFAAAGALGAAGWRLRRGDRARDRGCGEDASTAEMNPRG